MLQLIRDRTQGLVVGVIVFFICITFALFGIQKYLDAKGSVVVAEVNGEEIGLTDFQRTFQQLRQRAQAMFGEAFDPELWAGDEAKMNALNFLIDERLILQAVDKANIRASDAQVAEYIRTSPQFQEDGVFSAELYKRLIRSIGFSELSFEQQVRKDLVVNQLRAGIAATAFTTADELQTLEQYQQQTRNVGFAIMGVEAFREGISPQPDELETYYRENAENYRVEEKVSLSYLDLSIESLMKDIQFDDTQLQAYYDANKALYTVQEERNANHILVQVPRDASPEEEQKAREKAVKLREKALAGESFETIARETSDDIGSRTDGGETGFFGRGVMAPEFEQAVFAMKEGEISEPVRTDFGFHIIRLKEIKPGGIKSFEDAKPEITRTYQREKAEALFFEQAEQLAELAYEHPDTLDVAAETLGLTVQKTGLIPRSKVSELLTPRVTEAAFEPEVLVEGLNSEPIDVSNGRIIVVRVNEHEPSRIPSFDEVVDVVTTDFIDARARAAVDARGDEIVKQLNDGADLQATLAAEKLKWEDVPDAGRDSAKLNRAIARAAFRLAVPTADKVVYAGVPMGTGDYAVIGVSNVKMPPVEHLSSSDINQLRRDVSADRTAVAWRDFVDLLKTDADIESFPEKL